MKTIKCSETCPTCGKPLFAIYRNPFSPVHCEDGHEWRITYEQEKKIREDGRMHVISIKEILIAIKQ